jgi:hypothetical protein
MSNMSPFEIRLELLKMARDMLGDDYYGKREVIANQYAADCDAAKLKGEDPPKHPGYPPFPSEQDIIAKAKSLNEFVSNITVESKTTTKKST